MKKLLRSLLKTILVLFVLVNIITAFHAYKFTHIYDRDEVTIKSADQKTAWEKTSDILFGAKAVKLQNGEPDTVYTPVILTTKNSIKLDAWYLKTNKPTVGTVILFHGHLSKKSSVLDESIGFRQLGYNTLLVDFRAHGSSGGNTCTIGYFEGEDVKLAYDYVKNTGEKNIVLWGISMGAAAVTKAMNDYPLQPSKIILEMPFASILQAAEGRIKMMGLPGEPLAALVAFWGSVEQGFWVYDMKPAEFAKKITVPTLLQWGKNDPRVLQHETDQVYQSLAGKKQLVVYENAAHESLCDKEHDKWMASVSTFLNQ
ncbi:MAG: alpha/beta fold hydrolase [Bacteroidota bacterium]